jgi:predicted DsbA family dithiol-disulfide isomerase
MTVIEVFADIACPFAHVGLRMFVDRRRALDRDDVVLRVRAWPLEIVNGHPLDPHFIAEEVDEIRGQLGHRYFSNFTPEAFPASSLPAMTLAAAAYDLDPTTGELVSLELRDLLFEQGVDVADHAVLRGLAAAHGVTVDLNDPRQVHAEHHEGAGRGVVGSPHFFTKAGSFFCPALEVGRDASGRLHVVPDPGFDDFMTSCFES